MIEIKGQWEQVLTMDDCLRVISYHLGLEFANKVADLIQEQVPDIDDTWSALCQLEESLSDCGIALFELKHAVKAGAHR